MADRQDAGTTWWDNKLSLYSSRSPGPTAPKHSKGGHSVVQNEAKRKYSQADELMRERGNGDLAPGSNTPTERGCYSLFVEYFNM